MKKSVLENRTFWNIVNSSDKNHKKIIIVENDGTISKDIQVAEVLNTFSSNIVSNLEIPEYSNNDPIIDNINDPVLKAIFKYKNHTSIKAIAKTSKSSSTLFSFSYVDKEEVFKEIVSLDTSKASQDTDVPTKVIRENADLFTNFVFP